ncbi:MAG TPA: ribosome biogenesis GTPase Der [Burkholderiales bacterium]|jgi:GTP-binding protein|nr:ribosome biogenesis GTPase Der [Burkholderiales bacterium]
MTEDFFHRLPIIVLVGRPNVGKSTLFNRLTRSRAALVADVPGLTRDRHYGHGRVGDRRYMLIDTGGFEPVATAGIRHEMAQQARAAIDEADAVLFIVDARQGVTPGDLEIAQRLRESGRRLWLVVNKTEGLTRGVAAAEFHELGLGAPLAISAEHGEGVAALMEHVLADFPAGEAQPAAADDHPRIAVVGRPNVGKSTLVNRLLGENRMIVFDEPGTTRDSIHTEFERDGRRYTLIDTAGIRRRGRVSEAIEKFSAIKALQAIDDANVVILVLDARQDVADQDAHIAGYILEAGRALVIAVNKWDGLDAYARDQAKRVLARKLAFLDFAATHYISALNGSGVGALLREVDVAYRSAMARLPTPRLTRALIDATTQQAPPRDGLVRPKLRYAHQGGVNPPTVVVHGNALNRVSAGYRRYLERFLRRAFELQGTPLRVEFRQGNNPYSNNGLKRKR